LLRWRKICGWGWGKLAQALLVIARRKTSGVAGKSLVEKYQQKQIVMNIPQLNGVTPLLRRFV
jgi:hypothetical protein